MRLKAKQIYTFVIQAFFNSLYIVNEILFLVIELQILVFKHYFLFI